MRHHVINLAFLLLFFFDAKNSHAIDSESHREAVVSRRSKKFYTSNRSRQYLAFGGSYSSDYNSKEYQLTSRYLYQSNKLINEFNFKNEHEYADKGSGSSKQYYLKKIELYDLSLSSKILLEDSKNYLVLFHRTIYDNLSKYYYDLRSAVGVGRIFFNNHLELDASIGYHDVKNYGYKMSFIPSLRSKFRITKKLTLVQRGYLYLDHESMDNGLRTSLLYRLSKKLSFEIRHNFEQRRYENDTDLEQENFVNRAITIGLVFDLN